MATMRTYGERCAAARALDLVGERWALLVVRELLLGPKRFTDLRAGLPNARPSVLSQRLRELEDGGVVRRRRLGPPTGAWVYELTDWGSDLEPVVIALGRWGRRLPAKPGAAHGVDSLVLALKWRFSPERSGRLKATYDLRLAEDRFRIEVGDGRIEVHRTEADEADAVIETDPETLEALTFDGRRLGEAVRAGEVKIGGDTEAVERLLSVYAAPEALALTSAGSG
jgi:DNA-binding HxlR family transcriptional regulator